MVVHIFPPVFMPKRIYFSDSTCASRVDAELSSSDCEFMSLERSNLSLKKPGLQKYPGWTAVMATQAIATILDFMVSHIQRKVSGEGAEHTFHQAEETPFHFASAGYPNRRPFQVF